MAIPQNYGWLVQRIKKNLFLFRYTSGEHRNRTSRWKPADTINIAFNPFTSSPLVNKTNTLAKKHKDKINGDGDFFLYSKEASIKVFNQ